MAAYLVVDAMVDKPDLYDTYKLRAKPLVEEFESAMVDLEKAPLSSTDIREALTLARAEWSRLVQGLHQTDREAGRRTLSRKSDALLATFDRLTDAYEHSLQLLMS